MTLIDLVRSEARDENPTLLVAAVVAGAANAYAMALVNSGVSSTPDDKLRLFDDRADSLLDGDEKAVLDLLKQMQIDDKTSFAKGRFTKRDLSTGQRKRLAMIVALLEDRPIFLFDEWASDEDPEFRKCFYEELIPSLKRGEKQSLPCPMTTAISIAQIAS